MHALGVVRGTLKVYPDGSIQQNLVGSIEYSGSEGEGPVILSVASVFDGKRVSGSFDPQTGPLTLEFEESFVGKPEQRRAPGVGVIHMGSGSISWTLTVVMDTNTNELTSEELTNVTVQGQFPIYENGFIRPDAQLLCGLLGAWPTADIDHRTARAPSRLSPRCLGSWVVDSISPWLGAAVDGEHVAEFPSE